jgi:hypothetical protein
VVRALPQHGPAFRGRGRGAGAGPAPGQGRYRRGAGTRRTLRHPQHPDAGAVPRRSARSPARPARWAARRSRNGRASTARSFPRKHKERAMGQSKNSNDAVPDDKPANEDNVRRTTTLATTPAPSARPTWVAASKSTDRYAATTASAPRRACSRLRRCRATRPRRKPSATPAPAADAKKNGAVAGAVSRSPMTPVS